MESTPLRKPKQLLSPPFTKGLRAGFNVLKPGQSVGEHTTGRHEEILIILKGTALLQANGKKKTIKAGHVAYNPPRTIHDVTNSGKTTLEYIYVVS